MRSGFALLITEVAYYHITFKPVGRGGVHVHPSFRLKFINNSKQQYVSGVFKTATELRSLATHQPSMMQIQHTQLKTH